MAYIKQLINLFKLTKKENLDTIIDNLENVKTNINSIFDEVVNNNDFSQYKLDLLNRKLCLLKAKQIDYMYEYTNYIQNLNKLNHLMPKIIWFIVLLVAILSMYPLFPLQMLLVSLQIWVFSTIRDRVKNVKNNEKNLELLIREINNTTTTCDNFVYKKIKSYNEALHKEKDCTIEVLANELISHYIDNGIICNASKEVMDYAIKILQYELQSDKKDINVLLEDAKEKISEEALDVELLRSRNKDNK